ncbi:hypothetical protein [Tropicibacter oceani]|uniref:Lipoprotein n=1 Tax=Tropicibacter oceani TaxID=3058420 RepID=A0ABY8QM48_9RHOB|nr:hypothetical protein [Tropicibacter oceani]WGW05192.1 hypothetical protein QF118_06515 [Tropicibacter oceani]
MIRILVAFSLVLGLAACSDVPADLSKPPVALGDFKLGHAEVVAPNLQQLLVSREATKEEWIKVVDEAMEQRFRRYEGDKFYHIGISVEAYSLPPPVVPGKSALALHVTVWDDATQSKLNTKPEPIHVIKVFESRLSKNRDEQMQGLALEAALLIEKWLREEQETKGWFGGLPEVEEAAEDIAEAPADGPS